MSVPNFKFWLSMMKGGAVDTRTWMIKMQCNLAKNLNEPSAKECLKCNTFDKHNGKGVANFWHLNEQNA